MHSFRQTDFSPFTIAKIRTFSELTKFNAKKDNHLICSDLIWIYIESPSACIKPVWEATGQLVFFYFQAFIPIAL